MKRIIVIILLIGVFSILSAENWGEIKYTHGVVNVRQNRNTSSPIVSKLKVNERVKADFLVKNWYAIFNINESIKDESKAIGYVYAPLLFNTKKNENVGYTNYNETRINKLAYQLATINNGGYISKSDITITRFKYLLRTLDKKTFESKQNIADMTVKCQQMLRKNYGVEKGLLEIMENLNDSIPSGTKVKYAEIITLYILLIK